MERKIQPTAKPLRVRRCQHRSLRNQCWFQCCFRCLYLVSGNWNFRAEITEHYSYLESSFSFWKHPAVGLDSLIDKPRFTCVWYISFMNIVEVALIRDELREIYLDGFECRVLTNDCPNKKEWFDNVEVRSTGTGFVYDLTFTCYVTDLKKLGYGTSRTLG